VRRRRRPPPLWRQRDHEIVWCPRVRAEDILLYRDSTGVLREADARISGHRGRGAGGSGG